MIDGEVVVDGYSLDPGPTFNLQWEVEAGFGKAKGGSIKATRKTWLTSN